MPPQDHFSRIYDLYVHDTSNNLSVLKSSSLSLIITKLSYFFFFFAHCNELTPSYLERIIELLMSVSPDMLGSTIYLQYSKETGHSEKQKGQAGQRERGEREEMYSM